MERAIQVQLLAFLDKNKVLSVFQSGFSKKHSTETAVVYLVDHILEHMNRQQLAGAAFVDLKKAIDLVDHLCPLHKLKHYGVRGCSLTWFRNYWLLVRRQFNREKNYYPAFLQTSAFLKVSYWDHFLSCSEMFQQKSWIFYQKEYKFWVCFIHV